MDKDRIYENYIMNNLKSLKIAFMALLFMITAVFSIPISTCTTITSPGTYEITTPIDFSTTTTGYACIDIQSSDVILDGNGTQISNTGSTNQGIHIMANGPYNNITIKNAVLDGDGEAAIFIRGVNNTVIKNNTIYGFYNNTVGIYALGASVGDPTATTNLTIYNNTIRDFNYTAAGVVVAVYSNVNLSNNTIYNFGYNTTDVFSGGSSYGFLLDSYALANSFVAGYSVSGGTLENLTFANNNISNMEEWAVGARVSVVSGNLSAYYNYFSNASSNSTGMVIKDVSANIGTAYNNTFFLFNHSYGVIVGGDGITFENNAFNGFTGSIYQQYYGIKVDAANGLIKGNELFNSSQVDLIYVLGSNNNITQNKMHSYYGGSVYSGINTHVGSSYNVIYDNDFYNYSGSLTRAGMALTGTYNVVEYNRFYNMSGGGIYFIVNNIAYDNNAIRYNNFTNYTGGWALTLAGVVGQTNNTVEGNTIKNYTGDGGIQTTAGSFLVVNNTIADFQYNPSYGTIYLNGDMTGAKFANNTVANFSGTSSAIMFNLVGLTGFITLENNTFENYSGYAISGGADGANVTGNTFRNFSNGGAMKIQSTGVIFDSNSIETTTDGSFSIYGVYIEATPAGVNVTNNTITLTNTTATVTNSYGIFAISSTGVLIDSNTVSIAYYGIYFATTSSSTISNNQLCGANTGVYLDSTSSSNTGSGNYGTLIDLGSGNSVLVINNCGGSSLTSCVILNNTYNAAYTVDANLVGTAPGVSACIYIDNSYNVTIDCQGYSMTDPTVPNGDTGIFMRNVSDILVKNCVVNDYSFAVYSYDFNGLQNDNMTIRNTTFSGVDYVLGSSRTNNINIVDFIANGVRAAFFFGDINSTNIRFENGTVVFSSTAYVQNYMDGGIGGVVNGPIVYRNITFDNSAETTYADVLSYFVNINNGVVWDNIRTSGQFSTIFAVDNVSTATITDSDFAIGNNSVVLSNTYATIQNTNITSLRLSIVGQQGTTLDVSNLILRLTQAIATTNLALVDTLSGQTATLQRVYNITYIDPAGNIIFSYTPSGPLPIASQDILVFATLGPNLNGTEPVPAANPNEVLFNNQLLGTMLNFNISDFTVYYDDTLLPAGISESQLMLMWYNGSQWVNVTKSLDNSTNTITADINDSMAVTQILVDGAPYQLALVGLFYSNVTNIVPDYNITADVIFQVRFTGDNYASGYEVILQKRDQYGNYYVVGNGTTGPDGIVGINLSYNETVPQVFRVLITDNLGSTVYYQDKFVTQFNNIVLTPSFSFIDMMRQALLIGQNLLLIVLGIILISMHLFGWTKGLATGSFFSTMFLAGISYALEIPIEKIWLVWLVALTSMAVGAAIFLRRFDV